MFFMKKGKFYAVSTGAGSTELLTLKAIRILKGCEIIFYPEKQFWNMNILPANVKNT